jgi:hypothetical protein
LIYESLSKISVLCHIFKKPVGYLSGLMYLPQTIQRKPNTLPLCPPKTPHDLIWDQPWAAMVESWQLTIGIMGTANQAMVLGPQTTGTLLTPLKHHLGDLSLQKQNHLNSYTGLESTRNITPLVSVPNTTCNL